MQIVLYLHKYLEAINPDPNIKCTVLTNPDPTTLNFLDIRIRPTSF